MMRFFVQHLRVSGSESPVKGTRNHLRCFLRFMQDMTRVVRRPYMALVAVSMLFAVNSVAAQTYSPAERALFMTDHLSSARTPTTFQYTFRKNGSLEENFEDKVTVALVAMDKDRCCTASTNFLGGPRRIELPQIESPVGNPVILHFLERDIKEMQRLTKGQPNYFRKRIRMAVFNGANVAEVKVPYRGLMVEAQQIVISPYIDDPLRARYEKFASKEYVFTLSPKVPGGVYAIRAQVKSDSGGPPVLLEEMVLDETGSGAARTTSGMPQR